MGASRAARARGRVAGALLLAAVPAACGVSQPPVPEVVDLPALEARLRPAAGEKALLVNFWATW